MREMTKRGGGLTKPRVESTHERVKGMLPYTFSQFLAFDLGGYTQGWRALLPYPFSIQFRKGVTFKRGTRACSGIETVNCTTIL